MVLDFLKEDFSVNALEFPPRKVLGIYKQKKVAKNSLYILIEEDRFFPPS